MYAFDDISIANSNGKERQRRQNETHYKTVPDVLRVLSRRAPRGHDVTNLVRVALEPIALVFLKRLLFGEEKSNNRGEHTCARLRDVYKHFQFEREKHIIIEKDDDHKTKHTKSPTKYYRVPLRACPTRASVSWTRRVANRAWGAGPPGAP